LLFPFLVSQISPFFRFFFSFFFLFFSGGVWITRILINLATLKAELKQNQEATDLFLLAIANLKALKHQSVAMALNIFYQHLEAIGDKQRAADVKKEIDLLPKPKRK
jgi:hypothetical protein